MSETIIKIKEGIYEITKMKEIKQIKAIEIIDKNIQVLTDRLISIKNEKISLEKRKAEQEALKEKLLKIK